MSIKTYTEQIDAESVAKDLSVGVLRGLGAGFLIASLLVVWMSLYLAVYEVMADAGALAEPVWPASLEFWVDWAFGVPIVGLGGVCWAYSLRTLHISEIEYHTAAFYSVFVVSVLAFLSATTGLV